MRVSTKRVVIFTLLVLLAAVIAYYGFFYVYLRSLGYIPEVARLGDVIIEKNLLGNHITAPSHVPRQDVFAIATELAGFHVYYPTFLPDAVVMDRTSLWLAPKETKELASYDLTNKDPQPLIIYIVQKKIEPEKENSILMRTKNFQSKKKFLSDRCTGGVTHATATKTFNHLICSTEDGVVIWLRSEHFDLNTLVSIAEAMR